MASINTNIAAMTALKSLQSTNTNLERTQNAISTGYSVSNSKDNAAYWSIATTMRSDNKALSTVQDALGLGAAKLDTAYTGMNSAINVVDEIKSKLVAAREPGVDKSKIQSEITALQEQLKSVAGASSFSGENWLSVKTDATGYSSDKDVVGSFNRAADGSVSVGVITIDISSVALFDDHATAGTGILDAEATLADGTTKVTVADLDISALGNDDIDTLISHVDDALSTMTTAASDIGAAAKRVDLQKDFVSELMNAIDRGVSHLVDADMSEESTKLQALQVQQQLGIQALSIANSSSQNILSLFR